MVKEKRFNIHPEVLSCLLHLRLKTELGVRASESRTDKEVKIHSKGKGAARRAKGKATDQPHLSKKAQMALKEKKEIEKEFREAEAEVDKEERANTVSFSLLTLRELMYLNQNFLPPLSLANRNAQTIVRSVFPDSKESHPNTTSPGRPAGYLEIRASCEY